MDVLCADALAAVLRRLAPCNLAVARRVCTSWRDTVDGHRLLRGDLLPLSLDAVLFTTMCPRAPMLFSHRYIRCSITARLDYVGSSSSSPFVSLVDCCNGLVLLDDHVVNPATRQSARLPAPPRSCVVSDCTACVDELEEYLVYDPIVSPHYEVLRIPRIPYELPKGHITKHECCIGPVSAMEWPPSPYIMDVFSSETKCWTSRSFVRQGDAAGTVADLKTSDWDPDTYHSAYWHGVLYVRCEEGLALRYIYLDSHSHTIYTTPSVPY